MNNQNHNPGCCFLRPPGMYTNDVAEKSLLWQKDKKILYSIDGPDMNDQSIAQIDYWAKRFSKITGLSFISSNHWTQSDVRIRIQLGGPTNSYVGADALKIAKDDPTMRIGYFDNLNDPPQEYTVPHEWLHLLGIHHSQMHPQCVFLRDQLTKFQLDQNWNMSSVENFFWWKDRVRNNPEAFILSTPLSNTSMMWYRYPAFTLDENSKIFAQEGIGNRRFKQVDEDFSRSIYQNDNPIVNPPIVNPPIVNPPIVNPPITPVSDQVCIDRETYSRLAQYSMAINTIIQFQNS